MAKKRLNKKVALIGSVVFVFLVLVAIAAILYLSRDPEKFIRDGDTAVEAARAAVDEQIRQEEYERAERSYGKARALAKTDELRIEMLFRLVGIYTETDRWRNVLGCWNKIVQIDPENVRSRYGRLKYVYIMADTGVPVWQEVASQASELIEVAENAGLLAEDTAQWEPFELQPGQVYEEKLGPYLYLLRGRAMLEMTRLGRVTDPDESLTRAIDDLQKAQDLEPDNPRANWHLANAMLTRGELLVSRGNFEERDRAAEQARELLVRGVEVADSDVRAHINLLSVKLMLAERSPADQRQEQIESLEPECLSLVQRFPSSPQAHSALAGFYRLSPKNIDKEIEAAESAVELDKENVAYAISAAGLRYRRFSIYGQKSEIYKAIEIAKTALALPDAQDRPGPWQHANRTNRIWLYNFLANCYIEQILEQALEPGEVRTEAEKCLTDAEQVVHKIEQFVGSGEEPGVIKWQGMLELAKFELGQGDRNVAIKKLYAAYEQLKASGRADGQLSYALAKIFADTAETGAVVEFLTSALGTGFDRVKPESRLDYAEVVLKFEAWPAVISNVDIFEENFGPNQRSQTLRIRAYIGAGQFDEAEEELAGRLQPDDPNTIKLKLALVQARIGRIRRAITQRQIRENLPSVLQRPQAREEELEPEDSALMTTELKGYNDTLAELTEKLLRIEPNSVEEASFVAVYNNYIAQGRFKRAERVVNRYLECFPDNATAMFCKQMLSEPELDKISQQRREEIEKAVLSNIVEPVRRSVELGAFYQRNNEPNRAAEEFKKALGIIPIDAIEAEPASGKPEEIADFQRLAAERLLEIAFGMKDWELAEQIAQIAQRKNFDECDGKFFDAQLALARGQYKEALAMLELCLKHRPIFSHGFMLRSSVNTALGNEREAIEDAQKAASLNPLNGNIVTRLAFVLYRRNEKLGPNVSSDQIIETRDALTKAMTLKPGDWRLLSFYAEYISDDEPLRALAMRQGLARAAPNMENAVLLSRLATKMALKETEPERKEALFAVAASSLEQAQRYDPHDRVMLSAYAEYYRATGRDEKARQLLLESEDQKLLWSHYFRGGQFEDAKIVLEQLYRKDPKDSDVLKGLLLVAERTADKEAAVRYSDELLSLEDTVDNQLFQIQTFLKIGLVKQAEHKLQGFKEKYPDETRALVLDAWLAMRQGRLQEALELANQNLQSNQDNAIAWRLRGEANFFTANYDQAIIDLKRSRALLDEPLTRFALARAYLRAGREEDAITELKNTIDAPGAPMPARVLLEEIYLRTGRTEALKKFYRQTLEKFPDSVFWYNRVGRFAIAAKDYSTAERMYKRAWEKGKRESIDDAAALDGYLRALLLADKLDKVLEQGSKYIDSDFASIAFYRMAEAKMKLGDRPAAIQYCRKALDRTGENEALAANILQSMYLLLGAEEVTGYCNEKLKENPDSPFANLIMFNVAKIRGEYNKALAFIDKCLQIMGPDSRHRVDYVLRKAEVLTLAYVKTADNDYLQRAIEVYESLLAEMPNNTDVLNNLAYMLAEANIRLDKALEYGKRACDAKPNDPSLLDTYAYVLYKNGRYAEAAEFSQAALQHFEQDKISAPAVVYEHLGMIKEKLGAADEALAAYEQALQTGADTLPEAAKERINRTVERLSQQADKADRGQNIEDEKSDF